jgi:hypothetical protein
MGPARFIVILKRSVHAYAVATNLIAQILPAAFGPAGIIVVALIAQRGTGNQRRAESNAKARAQLAAFTQAAAEYVHPHRDRTCGCPKRGPGHATC